MMPMQFQDDGGTPEWRRRHAMVDIYPSRWAAFRAHMKRHPMAWISLGVLIGLLPAAVLFTGLAGIALVYAIWG